MLLILLLLLLFLDSLFPIGTTERPSDSEAAQRPGGNVRRGLRSDPGVELHNREL